MVQIKTTLHVGDALAALDGFSDRLKSKALPRALNKVADQAKVQASREIRDAGYQLKVSVIKTAITLKRANRNTLQAEVIASAPMMPLYAYAARRTKKGITVAVRSGQRKLIQNPHAFIATLRSGHTGIFERVVVGGKRAPRLPIRELYGPSIPQAFANKTVQQALVRVVRERFPAILEREIKFARTQTGE